MKKPSFDNLLDDRRVAGPALYPIAPSGVPGSYFGIALGDHE
jgi:hypothetical protein